MLKLLSDADRKVSKLKRLLITIRGIILIFSLKECHPGKKILFFFLQFLVSSFTYSAEDSLLLYEKKTGCAIAESERVSQFLTNIVEIETQMQENVLRYSSDITRVIVLGNTGIGKSTLVHALAKRLMIVQETEEGPCIDVNEENRIPNFVIKRGMISGTQQPTSWFYPDANLVFWDCPGFMDPSGVSKDIENLFAIERLFTSPCNIKIILAIDQSEKVCRGQSIIKRIRGLRSFFTAEEQLYRAVSIVVTKQHHWKGRTPEPKALFESMGLFNIEPNADGTRNLAAATETSSEDLIWISSFLIHLRDNDRIFSFPEPLDSGPYNYGWFPDRERILTDLATQPVANPTVNIFANFARDVRILLLMEQSAGQLDKANSQLKDLFVTIKHLTQDNVEQLRIAQSVVKEISLLPTELIKTPAKLAQQLRNRLGKFNFSKEEYNHCLVVIDKIIASEAYLNFLDKLDREKRSELWQTHIPNIQKTLQGISNDSLDVFNKELNKMENTCCIVS